MFRILAFIALATLSLQANANEIPFTCEVEGRTVLTVPTPNLNGAVAMYHRRTPKILYDPSWFFAHTKEQQTFIFAHECSHIILKHGTTQSFAYGMTPNTSHHLQQREREADCLGAVLLRNKLHFTDEQFNNITHNISNDPRLKLGAGITHPHPHERVQTINQCAHVR